MYKYAALAMRLGASEESSRYAPSALEMLAGSQGLNLSQESRDYHAAFGPMSEEQVQSATQIYSKKFEKARGEYKPSELASTWYSGVLSSVGEEDKGKIVAELGKYDETLASITKKIKKASRVLVSQKDDDFKDEYTPEQVTEARAVMEKYQKVMNVIGVLDNYVFEGLRPNAVNESQKKDLKGLASQL